MKIRLLHVNYFIISIFLLVFLMQYYLIETYHEKMFQYTKFDVKIEVLSAALKEYKLYALQNFIILIFQGIGMLLCLNIGFLYFGLNLSFKNILNLSIFSLLAYTIFQVLIVILIALNNWTITVGSFKAMTAKLSLVSYFNVEKKAPWIQLSLSSINLEQIFLLTILVIGLEKL